MKFVYDRDSGNVRVEAEDGEVLTEQEALIISVRNMAAAREWLGNKLGEISVDIASLPHK
jgi:hypothetical protein